MRLNRRNPRYIDDADYTTNSPSYYHDLGRKNKLLQKLAEKIWDYDDEIKEYFKRWEDNLENINEDVIEMMIQWADDGTLDHIINDTIFNWKADKTYVDSEIERLDQKDAELTTQKADNDYVDDLNEDLTTQLEQIKTEVENRGLNIVDFGVKRDGSDQKNKINEAINYAKNKGINKIFVPSGTYMIDASKPEGSWIDDVGGIELKDNMTIVFEKGAVFEALPTSSEHYAILSINNVSNVTVIGGNFIGERYSHQGITGEFGFGVQIINSKQIKIINATAKNCWGDGFYTRGQSEYLTMIDCVSDNNRRQGLSIINGSNIKIIRSIFKNTNGIQPEAGVDIEPNQPDEFLKNVVFDGCIFENNAGRGLMIDIRRGALCENVSVLNSFFYDNSLDSLRVTVKDDSKLLGLNIENFKADGSLYVGDSLNVQPPKEINNVTVKDVIARDMFFSGVNNLNVDTVFLENGRQNGLTDVSTAFLENLYIKNMQEYGFNLNEGLNTDIFISSFLIENSIDHGISSLSGSSKGVDLSNGKITGGSGRGISLAGARKWRITNVDIIDNEDLSIVTQASNEDLIIKNCRFDDALPLSFFQSGGNDKNILKDNIIGGVVTPN